MESTSSIRLQKVVDKLLEVRNAVLECDDQSSVFLKKAHPNYKYNALNLFRYLKLRNYNLGKLQGKLTALGISSLSHAERHVLANIENTLYLLCGHLKIPFEGKYAFAAHPVNFTESAKRLKNNSKRLFGKHIKHTAIMVTLPEEATNPDYVDKLLISGMNVARINCSHDSPEIWALFVENIRKRSEHLKLPCSIYADLSGPKIRLKEILTPLGPNQKKPRLRENDHLILLKDIEAVNFIELEENDILATISIPSILKDVRINDRILIDDGKMGGQIISKFDGGIKILITHSNPKGGKLKGLKGINFPDTHLYLPSLTEEDLINLDFITQNCDMVGYSFVRKASDVKMLQEELKKKGASDIGIILKIENRQAFENLPQLILQGMESPTLGVMTARGDLAVELGAERLSEVQEEIMWICESAMIPNILATQVLETLTKKGIPTRAEITDAAMSIRAECVMLNKGPYIEKALTTLVNILNRMDKHQNKKLGTLRKLKIAKRFWKRNEKLSIPSH